MAACFKFYSFFAFLMESLGKDSTISLFSKAFHTSLTLSEKRASQGGCVFPCSLWKIVQLFPCSSKINWGVPQNSFLLSSPVPRNCAPYSVGHQKYPSLFPTIPSTKNKIFELSPGQGPKNERNCNTLPICCRRKGRFPCYTLKKFLQWPGNQCSLVPDYNSTVPLCPKNYFKISLVP